MLLVAIDIYLGTFRAHSTCLAFLCLFIYMRVSWNYLTIYICICMRLRTRLYKSFSSSILGHTFTPRLFSVSTWTKEIWTKSSCRKRRARVTFCEVNFGFYFWLFVFRWVFVIFFSVYSFFGLCIITCQKKSREKSKAFCCYLFYNYNKNT